jgi:hypothetical protein
LGAKVVCGYDDSAGGRKKFRNVFIAAVLASMLDRAVESIIINQVSEEWARGQAGV